MHSSKFSLPVPRRCPCRACRWRGAAVCSPAPETAAAPGPLGCTAPMEQSWGQPGGSLAASQPRAAVPALVEPRSSAGSESEGRIDSEFDTCTSGELVT